jgi:damage-control phosphatase, subfamily I
MKAIECCIDCLKGLAKKTVKLSNGDDAVLANCYRIVDQQWKEGNTPPRIANRLLKQIKQETGVYDPYASLKEKEFEEAKRAIVPLEDRFTSSLELLLKLSALGNSMDFFTGRECGFDAERLRFFGDIDKIEEEIYIKGKDVLMLGDNIGDFLFDMPLVKFLEGKGKRVHYAVKEHPVQNDLSMADAVRFGFVKIFDNIISSGTDEVGMRRDAMKGKIKDLWEKGDAVVIAKGMGNYETMSEYHVERSVVHIMKVKCPAVSKAVGQEIGTYIAALY